MTGTYYYLVAGLPDLLPDEGKCPLSCVDFIDEATDLLSKADTALFNLLRLPFDNENLCALLEKKERQFDRRGTIGESQLSDSLKSPEMLPQYMQSFLETLRENRPPVPGCSIQDHLAWFFYEAMSQCANEFVRTWYAFDLDLRNLVTGINLRRGFDHLTHAAPGSLIVGRNDVAELILKSTSPDFGVSAILPWAEKVFALSGKSLAEFEKGLDMLRWEMLSELTEMHFFKAETVFAFFLKLTIAERWQALDSHTGKLYFDRLASELAAAGTAAAGINI